MFIIDGGFWLGLGLAGSGGGGLKWTNNQKQKSQKIERKELGFSIIPMQKSSFSLQNTPFNFHLFLTHGNWGNDERGHGDGDDNHRNYQRVVKLANVLKSVGFAVCVRHTTFLFFLFFFYFEFEQTSTQFSFLLFVCV